MDEVRYFEINTPEDVKNFFRYVFGDLECFIHPDDDFNDVIDIHTEERFFSLGFANKLNSYMDRCFRICVFYNLDIYEIAIEIEREIYGKH